MLKIGLHVRDTNNYVKCLGISHNAAILEKVRDVRICFSRLAAILENLCDVPIYLIITLLAAQQRDSVNATYEVLQRILLLTERSSLFDCVCMCR